MGGDICRLMLIVYSCFACLELLVWICLCISSKATQIINLFWHFIRSWHRDAGTGGGGGGSGGNLPPQLGSCGGADPSTLVCQCSSFLFLFVFARELGSLPKIVGQIHGVFRVLGRGYLGPRETFPPPPQLQSSSRAPVMTSQIHRLTLLVAGAGAHLELSRGEPNFFPCIVASRVRKINFT